MNFHFSVVRKTIISYDNFVFNLFLYVQPEGFLKCNAMYCTYDLMVAIETWKLVYLLPVKLLKIGLS